MTTDSKEKFKNCLERLTVLFQHEYNKEKADQLRVELDAIDKNEIIENWLLLLKSQGPVEKVSDLKYEIYDVSNFLGEGTESSNDYIHIVELGEFDTTSSVFMKFYLVFFCLVNGIRSSEYNISFTKGGWM